MTRQVDDLTLLEKQLIGGLFSESGIVANEALDLCDLNQSIQNDTANLDEKGKNGDANLDEKGKNGDANLDEKGKNGNENLDEKRGIDDANIEEKGEIDDANLDEKGENDNENLKEKGTKANLNKVHEPTFNDKGFFIARKDLLKVETNDQDLLAASKQYARIYADYLGSCNDYDTLFQQEQTNDRDFKLLMSINNRTSEYCLGMDRDCRSFWLIPIDMRPEPASLCFGILVFDPLFKTACIIENVDILVSLYKSLCTNGQREYNLSKSLLELHEKFNLNLNKPAESIIKSPLAASVNSAYERFSVWLATEYSHNNAPFLTEYTAGSYDAVVKLAQVAKTQLNAESSASLVDLKQEILSWRNLSLDENDVDDLELVQSLSHLHGWIEDVLERFDVGKKVRNKISRNQSKELFDVSSGDESESSEDAMESEEEIVTKPNARRLSNRLARESSISGSSKSSKVNVFI